ncbi:MAG: phosphatase PAP2 family protein [Lachnospiraceae bacterium]|nr:phosphatase PAP2 family protein [Lachnospiraceae bacterium]
MELEILYAIQGWHTELLDKVMVFISALGNGGLIWIAISVVLLIPQKTRRMGFTMMGAMALSYLLGNLMLKNLIGRARPCVVDTSVTLLIPQPGEYSFPSGHTLNGFTAATVIFLYSKKAGIPALVFAAAIAFSRLYLFVHYPTDILGGILLGVADAVIVYMLVQRVSKRKEQL